MSSVEFNEEQLLPNQSTYSPVKKSAFVNKLISWGIAKDQKSANVILLILSGIALTLMIAILYFVVFDNDFPRFGSENKIQNNNARIIDEYRDQGLKDSELRKKIQESREAGIIK